MAVGLEVELKAEMRQFERNMRQASNTTETRLRQIERRFEQANRKVAANNNFSKLSSGLQGISGGAPGAAAGLSKLGVAGVAAAAAVGAVTVALAKAGAVAQWADDLQTAADVVGITTEELQKFRHAAAVADVDVAAADKSLQGLNASLGAFKSGVGAGRVEKVFERLGITAKDVKDAQTASDFLPLLADRLSQVQSKAERVKLAKALQIEELLPLLEMGADRIKDLGDEAERLGLMLDSGTIKSLADMNEELRIADERMDLASKAIFANFVPGLVAMKTASAEAAVAVANLINRLRELPEDKMAQLQNFLLAAAPQLGIVGGPVIGTTLRALGAANRAPTQAMSPEQFMLEQLLKAESDRLGRAGGSGSGVSKPGKSGKSADDGIFTGPDANGFIDAENIGLIEAMDHAVVDVTEAFQALVREIDQNPDIKPGPPEMERLGDQFYTPEAYEALHDGLYGAIRGGLEAGFRDGVPGVVAYLAQAAQKALLDSIAQALTQSILTSAAGQNGGGWQAIAKGALSIFGSAFGGTTGSTGSGLTNQTINWPKLAGGGPVRGPGGPRDDRVPIWASDGEYMINAASAKKHRALLELINSDDLTPAHMIARFADGGMIRAATSDGGREFTMCIPRR